MRQTMKLRKMLGVFLAFAMVLTLLAPISAKADNLQVIVLKIEGVEYEVTIGAAALRIYVPDTVNLSDNLEKCELWVVSVDGNPVKNVGNKSGVTQGPDDPRNPLEIGPTMSNTKTEWIGRICYHADMDPEKSNQKYGFEIGVISILAGAPKEETGLFGKITLATTSFTYNGKVQTPGVTVETKDGNLVPKEFYELSYVGEGKDVGIYTVTATGTGDFAGSKISAEYKITPKGTTISKLTPAGKAFTVKLKKNATQTSGYQVRYRVKGGSWKTVTIKKNTTTSKKITGLKAKTAYEVQVRTYKSVGSKQLCSAWSATKSVTTK